MYLPSHFQETRADVLQELIRTHPLGTLVTFGPDGLNANHVPFEYDPHPAPLGILRAHVARANPVWREAATDVPSLVVFQGPDAYVSPSWYPSKAEHGKVVPTWNYVMVQARGPLRAIDDPAWLLQLVTRLTERHETPRSAPWAVSDAPADYVQTMLRAIVGIELELTSLSGKWKVTQNRPAADRAGVVDGLKRVGDDAAMALAAQVERPGSVG